MLCASNISAKIAGDADTDSSVVTNLAMKVPHALWNSSLLP